MRFHKHFLIGFGILLLSFNHQALSMEDNSSDSFSASKRITKRINLPDLPLEIQAYILSFLNQQGLLRAGSTSKSWRQIAERLWKNKPLNLSNRHLKQADYKALAQGPFFFSHLAICKIRGKKS